MTQDHADYAAQIFRQECAGVKMSPKERTFLQGLLDRMDTPERTGAIAAIIKVMVKL